MVKIHMMKAQEGDFIWLSYGDMEKEYHLLIDGGVKDCRERYADVVRSISAKGESIELLEGVEKGIRSKRRNSKSGK